MKNESILGTVMAASYRHEERIENYDADLRQDLLSLIVELIIILLPLSELWEICPIKFKGHKITWRNLYNRRFTHETNYRDAQDHGSSRTMPRDKRRLLSRQIFIIAQARR